MPPVITVDTSITASWSQVLASTTTPEVLEGGFVLSLCVTKIVHVFPFLITL